MNSFLLALQFLTTIPVRSRDIGAKKMALSMLYFPLVGLLLGLILAGANKGLYFLNLEQYAVNVVLVVLLIILTGGLHLDGLADTFDALAANRDKIGKLEVMRDSRIGTMGVTSLISVMLLKIFFLSEASSSIKFPALLSMCALSRWTQVFCIHRFSYARDNGKAKVFFSAMNNKIFLAAGLITLLLSIMLLWLNGIYLFLAATIFAFLLGKFFSSQFSGLTGDTLGAINEISEVFILFIIIVINRLI